MEFFCSSLKLLWFYSTNCHGSPNNFLWNPGWETLLHKKCSRYCWVRCWMGHCSTKRSICSCNELSSFSQIVQHVAWLLTSVSYHFDFDKTVTQNRSVTLDDSLGTSSVEIGEIMSWWLCLLPSWLSSFGKVSVLGSVTLYIFQHNIRLTIETSFSTSAIEDRIFHLLS